MLEGVRFPALIRQRSGSQKGWKVPGEDLLIMKPRDLCTAPAGGHLQPPPRGLGRVAWSHRDRGCWRFWTVSQEGSWCSGTGQHPSRTQARRTRNLLYQKPPRNRNTSLLLALPTSSAFLFFLILMCFSVMEKCVRARVCGRAGACVRACVCVCPGACVCAYV